MSFIRRVFRPLSALRVRGALIAGLGLLAILSPSTAGASQTVKFRMVVEGDVIAIRTFAVAGETSLCEEQLKGEFREYTQFLRGKGVVLEFTRSKSKGLSRYGVKRLSHAQAAFTVVTTSTRQAKGNAVFELTSVGRELAKISPAVQCPNPYPDLSKTGSCGTPVKRKFDVVLKVAGSLFTIKASENNTISPLPKPLCGETSLTSGFLGLEYEFPHFVPLDFEPLPEQKMFGPANGIAVKLTGNETGSPKTLAASTLKGEETDDGVSEVVVRFIRCGERKQPAC